MPTAYQKFTGRQKAARAATPQTLPIPSRESEMVVNNAGGYGFVLSPWERLNRFLVLGSEGGTYYVGETKLTEQNAKVVEECLALDGQRVVEAAATVNLSNRAPKTSPAIFVLAVALVKGNQQTRDAVNGVLLQVLRTGSHFLEFASYLDGLGGWGPAKTKALRRWWLEKPVDALAFQSLKYQQRNGWSMRDTLRLAHPKPKGEGADSRSALFDWVCGRNRGPLLIDLDGHKAAMLEARPEILCAYELMHACEGSSEDKALLGIRHGLPREALPTESLTNKEVWAALLPATPPHALLRNLGRLAAGNLLDDAGLRLVEDKLRDREWLKRARVHPFAILLASMVYRSGQGVLGNKTWIPESRILEALDDAFEHAFEWTPRIPGRTLIAIDESASMGAGVMGGAVTVSTAAAAMTLSLSRICEKSVTIGFSYGMNSVRVIPVTKRSSLSNLISSTGGGTDLSLPFKWAEGLTNNQDYFDGIVVLTDNETWAGGLHPCQALVAYRKASNPEAKAVCCAMTASHANVVDPADPLQLGCAGLDASLPSIVGDFLGAGEAK